MTEIIKHLKGYSGSQVTLMNEDQHILVRKFGQNARNLERIQQLSLLNLPVPKIYNITDKWYDMEYIPHTNMTNWLLYNHIDGFLSWFFSVIDKLSKSFTNKDYLPVYKEKLKILETANWAKQLPFTSNELINKLPRYLPQSQYHGDFTMDNCLHGTDGKFYLIDPLTTDYDSWVFDVAKIMQDLECGWFIRHSNVMIHGKLWSIRTAILQKYSIANDPNLLILMLLRVLPYAKSHKDCEFLIREIKQLWK